MASFYENIFGKQASTTQVPRYSPQQASALNQLAQMGSQGLQNLNMDFTPIEQRARSQFHSNTVPTIANRFLAGNTGGSSGLNAALGSAGADLEAGLAGARGQYNNQRFNQMLQLLQLGLQPQSEQIYQPESYGLLGQLGGGALNLGNAYLQSQSGGISQLIELLTQLLQGGGQR